MKKLLLALTFISIFSFSVFAQDSGTKNPEKWSDMTYVNVPIVKVYEGRDAYVVLYQKKHVGIGKTVIPKKWVYGTPDQPRKLMYKTTTKADGCYMSVQKKNGEFKRVVLTLPLNKHNSIWGVADLGSNIEGSDKETLEELDF